MNRKEHILDCSRILSSSSQHDVRYVQGEEFLSAGREVSHTLTPSPVPAISGLLAELLLCS